jgi:hypothetical protein
MQKQTLPKRNKTKALKPTKSGREKKEASIQILWRSSFPSRFSSCWSSFSWFSKQTQTLRKFLLQVPSNLIQGTPPQESSKQRIELRARKKARREWKKFFKYLK